MTASKAQAILEADFALAVTELAKLMGYYHCHVRRTVGRGRRWVTGTSVKGWPDYCFWRPGRLFFAELKAEDGIVSYDQERVIYSLRDAGVDCYIWRPSDWPEIEKVFTAHMAAADG